MAKVSIVSPAELILRWQTLQVVDARSLNEYRNGHIPGAIHMDWRDYRAQELSLQERLFGLNDGVVLSQPEKISYRLSALRLREDLPILVYGGTSRWGEEGRVAWNLLFWGAQEVLLLDGGWNSWVKAREEVRATVHPYKIFKVKLDDRRRIEFHDVKEATSRKKKILDVRSSSELTGGKIPSAVSFLDNHLYRKDGLYPTKKELSELLPEISSTDIVYCAGGVRSALSALLIEVRFGVIVKNYDGSMWDWVKKSRP